MVLRAGDDGALIAAAVQGRALGEIAQSAGVSISTVQRRLRDREVAKAIREARVQARRETVGQALSLRTAAMARAGELLGSDDPGVALRAASLLLSNAARIETAYDFSERLSALEADRDGTERDDTEPDVTGSEPTEPEPADATASEP